MVETAEQFEARLKAKRAKIPHVFTYKMKVYRLLRQEFKVKRDNARCSLEDWDKTILWTCDRLRTVSPHTCAELLLDWGNI